MYDEISAYRDPHADVIHGEKAATPEELARIAADLRRALRRMDAPDMRDLGEGNLYLRFRRYNLLIDLVKIEARTGNTDAALDAWDALSRFAWMPMPISSLAKDEHVLPLTKHPRYARIESRQRAAQWIQGAPALSTPYREQLSVEERIAGLSRLWGAAREGFVWFDHVPDLDWDAAYMAAIPKVIEADDTAAYYRELMRFVALLRDGHSNVYPPEEIRDRFYSRPGLRTARVEGKVVVTGVHDAGLVRGGVKVGDELVAVDGEPVESFAEREVVPYQSSSTPQDREVRAYIYALLAGPADRPVRLTLAAANRSPYEVEAARSGYSSVEPAPVSIFTLRPDGVVILRARQFENDEALRQLRQNAKAARSAKAWVIDLRGNGGGSSGNGLGLLAHLVDGPVSTTRSFVPESTPLARARARSEAPIEWRSLDGGSFENDAPWTYPGPVAMLIDARTFSAAEDTAAAFKLMRRGRIYGAASGGSTGQPWMFELPGGGRARICVKRDEYPDGTSFVGTGVLPDMSMAPSVDDIRQGSDPVLERAVADLFVELSGTLKASSSNP